MVSISCDAQTGYGSAWVQGAVSITSQLEFQGDGLRRVLPLMGAQVFPLPACYTDAYRDPALCVVRCAPGVSGVPPIVLAFPTLTDRARCIKAVSQAAAGQPVTDSVSSVASSPASSAAATSQTGSSDVSALSVVAAATVAAAEQVAGVAWSSTSDAVSSSSSGVPSTASPASAGSSASSAKSPAPAKPARAWRVRRTLLAVAVAILLQLALLWYGSLGDSASMGTPAWMWASVLIAVLSAGAFAV